MCGIFGVVDIESRPVNENNLRQILSGLAHRGPNDEGIYTNNYKAAGLKLERKPSVGLGHRRLSIIDLSPLGHQPMSNEDGAIWIVLNGEIYNYKDLRKNLEARGHKFKSNTDTEAIIHLYEEYGEDCVLHLRGMFAFAIWDDNNNQLLLAKDRLGKKPLFYKENEEGLIFSSEIKSILLYDKSVPHINYRGLLQYLNYFYIPAPETAFRGIKKLSPAHILIYKNGISRSWRYWDLDYSRKVSITFDEAKEVVRDLIAEAVSIRLVSDVAVGAFISGGLDSSIVAGIMSSANSTPVKTYSIGFEYKELNELPYSKIVANHFNTTHHELIIGADTIMYLPALIENFGEPHADSSALPTYVLSKFARNDISVALVGEGSDELFAGYNRYFLFKIFKYFERLPSPLKKVFNISLKKRYKKWIGVFLDSTKGKILTREFLEQEDINEPDIELFKIISDAGKFDGIDSALYIDAMYFLPYDLLVKIDVSTMAHSLEARAPFLDHRLIEFVASLPPKWKLNGIKYKYILKEAFKEMLPTEIINRKKTGFIVPVNYWFRDELKDYVRDILLSATARKRGYFNTAGIERLLNDHINGKCDYGHQIWTLLVFELWHSIFMDNLLQRSDF